MPAAEPRGAQAAATPDTDDIPLPEEPFDPYAEPLEVEPAAAAAVAEPEPEVAQPESSGLDAEAVRKRFQEVRLAVRERSKSLEPMLSAAFVDDVHETTVILGHPTEVLANRLGAPHAVEILRTALREVFDTDLDVRTVHKAASAAVPTAATTPTRPEPKRQTFSRPSRAQATDSADTARAQDDSSSQAPAQPPEPAEPEEPEPPRADEDIPDDERAEMVADAKTGAPEGRHDPGKVALELLQSELGARPLE